MSEVIEEHRLKREVASGPHDAADARPSRAVPGGRPQATNSALSTAQTTRALASLAWPIATAMLGETAIGLVDTKLVGGLGAAALGGVGLGAMMMFLAYSFAYGLLRGVKVKTTHAVGEGIAEDGFVYARSGMILGMAIGALVLVSCRDIGPLLTLFGTSREVAPYARDFVSAVTLGAPATCALAALIQHRQAIGDSRTPMIVGIVGNVVNCVLGWSLIYGHFGFSALGVRGGGYSTAITETLEFAVMFAMFIRIERRSPIASTLGIRDAARGVAELGVPLGFQFSAEVLAFSAFTAIISGIDKDEIAAHQIGLNVIRISFLFGLAAAEAASIMVGQALGARNVRAADAAVKSALILAVAIMASYGIVFAFFGGTIARFFSADPHVGEIATHLLFVAAIFQILDGVTVVFRGALRGAKDVRMTAVFGTVITWTFVPTAAYVLGKHYGLGALGGWLGFIGETTVSALVFGLRWKRGPWRKAYATK